MHSVDEALKRVSDEVGRVVVGQRALVEGLLTALLAHGHVLVEGVPGLAKTLLVKTLAEALVGLPVTLALDEPSARTIQSLLESVLKGR